MLNNWKITSEPRPARVEIYVPSGASIVVSGSVTRQSKGQKTRWQNGGSLNLFLFEEKNYKISLKFPYNFKKVLKALKFFQILHKVSPKFSHISYKSRAKIINKNHWTDSRMTFNLLMASFT